MSNYLLVIEHCSGEAALIRDRIRAAFGATVSVLLSSTIEEARREFYNHPIDAVILDLSLPGSVEVEAIHQIRELSLDVPIICFSANGDESLKYKSLASGALVFIARSDIKSLPAAIVTCLDERRRRLSDMQGVAKRLDAILAVSQGTDKEVKRVAEEVHRIAIVVFGNPVSGDRGLVGEAAQMRHFRSMAWRVIFASLGVIGTAIVSVLIARLFGVSA